ncbi:MAG: hypothetical protein ABIR84_09690, partial [Candidatus Nitrotoga sp.]
MIARLRWCRDKRRSKTGTPEGRGHIAQMQSIHLRPPEASGSFNTGTLGSRHDQRRDESFLSRHVGRTYHVKGELAKMADGTAQSALNGFIEALSAIQSVAAQSRTRAELRSHGMTPLTLQIKK